MAHLNHRKKELAAVVRAIIALEAYHRRFWRKNSNPMLEINAALGVLERRRVLIEGMLLSCTDEPTAPRSA